MVYTHIFIIDNFLDTMDIDLPKVVHQLGSPHNIDLQYRFLQCNRWMAPLEYVHRYDRNYSLYT
jgi:hypothetical protein